MIKSKTYFWTINKLICWNCISKALHRSCLRIWKFHKTWVRTSGKVWPEEAFLYYEGFRENITIACEIEKMKITNGNWVVKNSPRNTWNFIFITSKILACLYNRLFVYFASSFFHLKPTITWKSIHKSLIGGKKFKPNELVKVNFI